MVSGAGLGGEKSGHVIIREHTTSGDGIVTALEVLRRHRPHAAGRSRELAAEIPLLPQQQRAVPVRHKDQWEADPVLPARRRPGATRELGGTRPDPRPAVRHRARAADHGRGRGRRARRPAGRRARGARRRASKLAAARSRARVAQETRTACAGSSATSGRARRRPSCSRASRASSTAATTRPGIALVDDARRPVRREARRQAGQPPDGAARRDARTPRSASPTPAGRPTAGRTTSTPIPTQDCTGDITVIHNGIIENFRELRDGLEARGHALALRDRHRGARPPRRGGLRRRPRRGRPRRAAPGPTAPTRWRSCTAASRTGWSARGMNVPLIVGPRRRRELPRLATWPRSWPTPTGSSSSRRATSPTCGRRA